MQPRLKRSVRASIGFILDLLGRHEIGRPDHDSFVGIEDVARLPGHPDQLPESEVEHLHDPRY